MFRRRSSRAGRYADDRYRELRGRYRRRLLPRLLAVVLPVAVVALLVSVFADGVLRWVGGVWLGAACTFFIAIWDTPPAHIERRLTGAEGERRTGRALKQLERVGVVVVWASLPARVATAGGITYVAGEHLADWLIGQPRQPHREQLARLSAATSEDLLAAEPEQSSGGAGAIH